MFANLRQAMVWMHSVLGLGFAGVLFVAFFMGSLALYDHELDRWMLPQTRLPKSEGPLSLDRQVALVVDQLFAKRQLTQWYVELPSDRVPLMRLQAWDSNGHGQSHFIAPDSGQVITATSSRGGDFFYRFHYSLNLDFARLGILLVGLASMVGFLATVSGVLIHARLLKDLFSFQPEKTPRRLLDLHTLSGVFNLPFAVLMLLSGLIILFPLYLPAGVIAAYQQQAAEFSNEAQAAFSRPASGLSGSLASLDAMVERSRKTWADGTPAFVRVWHPGDAQSYVEIGRSLVNRLSLDGETLYFDGASGQLLHEARLKPAASFHSLLTGLHVAHFHHPLLRALYFLAGLSGCITLASGLLYWSAKRRRDLPHAYSQLALVDLLNAGLIGGLPMATLAMLVANQLLPQSLANRADWEVAIFFATWLGVVLHTYVSISRSAARRPAWRSLSAGIAILATAAMLLNIYNGVRHGTGQFAAIEVDAILMLSSLLAALFFKRLPPCRHGQAGERNGACPT